MMKWIPLIGFINFCFFIFPNMNIAIEREENDSIPMGLKTDQSLFISPIIHDLFFSVINAYKWKGSLDFYYK